MDKKKVGEFLASKRKRLGISQIDMAQRIGVNRTTIMRLENGTNAICRTKVASFANAYEVGTKELLDLCEYPVESLPLSKDRHANQVVTATIEDLKFLVMVAGELKQPLTLSAIIELLRCRQPKSPSEVG